MIKKKWILELDEEPALLFIQHKAGSASKTEIFQDGKKLVGVRSITIQASADDLTTHEVKFLTGYTDIEGR